MKLVKFGTYMNIFLHFEKGLYDIRVVAMTFDMQDPTNRFGGFPTRSVL